jgi:methyl halide transferase
LKSDRLHFKKAIFTPTQMSDLSSTAWNKRYQTGDAPWDLGFPTPPFVNLLSSPEAPKLGRIGVLGCGGGSDALLFAEAGFEVLGFDFAPTAIDRANARTTDRGY